eukprot:g14683.t1
MPASDAVVSSGEERRLALSVAAQRRDQHQGPSASAAPPATNPTASVVLPLGVSVHSPNEPSTARLQLHPPNAKPKQFSVLSNDGSSSSSSSSGGGGGAAVIPAPVLARSAGRKTSTTTNAASGVDEGTATVSLMRETAVREKASAKAVPMSEKVTAVSQPGTTEAVEQEDRVTKAKAVAVLAKDGSTTAAAATVAAEAAGTVTAVDEKKVGEMWCWHASSPSRRPSSGEKLTSRERGEEGVEQGVGLIACESKLGTKLTEERLEGAVRGAVAKGAAAMPTEAVRVPAKLGQTLGTSIPAAPAVKATSEAPSAGAATVAPAAAKDGHGESAAEDSSAPAAISSLAEVTMVLDEDGSTVEKKLSLFSRFSSVFSRKQQLTTSTASNSSGANDDGSAFAIAADVKNISSAGSRSASEPEHTGEISRVAPTGGAKPTREVSDHPAAAPPSAKTNRLEECHARESPGEATRPVAQTSKEAQEAAATSRAAAPSSASPAPGDNSKLSSPPARRTYSPPEKRRTESATRPAEAAAASPFRPRPALTPPGYRSRPSPPPADGTDAPRGEGSRSVGPTSRPSPPGPRPTGLTPPGYLSRLSPPSAGSLASARGLGGTGSEANGSTGARPSGLTPPGHRSRVSPPPASRTESPGREAFVQDPASCCFPSVRGSGVVKLTPDRRRVGAPACECQAGSLEGDTTPRCGVSPCPAVSSPARQPLGEQRREVSRGAAPTAEDEDEKAEAREQDAGCSPVGSDGSADGSDSPKHGVGPQCSSPCVANGHASTQTLLAGVVASPGTSSLAQAHPQKQLQRQQHVDVQLEAGPPMNRSSCREDAAGGALDTCSPTNQRPPLKGSNGEEEEEEGQRPQITHDVVCSPISRGSGSPTGGDGAHECSTPRFGTARVASTPPIAKSAANGVFGDASVGVVSPNPADAQALPSDDISGAFAASTPPPPPLKDERGKGQKDGSPREFHRSPNFAAGFVARRRKRTAVSGVPFVTAAAVEESPEAGNGGGGRRVSARLERAKRPQEERKGGDGHEEEERGEDEESSSGESGSSWETCSSSEEEEEEEKAGDEGWGRLSYLDAIDEQPFPGGVVIDPDLVRSGSSSNGGGSTRSSLPRSSFGEARSGGRRSWGSRPPSVVTKEMGTQTSDGEEVAHALVQAGDGRLLSEDELQDDCDKRELRERLEMMNHDRLSEVFHREIVKQEEAQKRKKLSEQKDAECLELREEIEALKLAHNNEKIRIRWEHADELARVEAEAGDGAGLMEELQEERRLREQDREHHVAAQQKERQQRKEWEARCDDLVREKREQAKRHSEELRNQVAAEKRKLEALKKKLGKQHKEAQKKTEEVVKEQLQALKEIDQENDELREENDELRKENVQLREKLGMEVEDEGGEEEEEEEEEEGSDLVIRKTLILFEVTQASLQMFGVLLESVAKLWNAFWATGFDFDSTSFGEEPAPALHMPQAHMDVDEREQPPFAPVDVEIVVNDTDNDTDNDNNNDDDHDDAPARGFEVEAENGRTMATKLAVEEFISVAIARVAAQVPILAEEEEEEEEEDGSSDLLLDGGSSAKSSTVSSVRRGRKNDKNDKNDKKGTSSQGGSTKGRNKKIRAKQKSYELRGVTGAEAIVIEDPTKSEG